MIKLKYAPYLLVLIIVQACASPKSSSAMADESGSETQSDSLTVNRSKTAEESGIKVSETAKKRSIITPEKKKK